MSQNMNKTIQDWQDFRFRKRTGLKGYRLARSHCIKFNKYFNHRHQTPLIPAILWRERKNEGHDGLGSPTWTLWHRVCCWANMSFFQVFLIKSIWIQATLCLGELKGYLACEQFKYTFTFQVEASTSKCKNVSLEC